jgi:hypothetical protein
VEHERKKERKTQGWKTLDKTSLNVLKLGIVKCFDQPGLCSKKLYKSLKFKKFKKI